MSKILVIEDQDDIRSIICEILTAESFNVIEAEDGHIGVLLAQEEMPDLIVCDIMMPEFDGYSVMTQLRQNPYVQSIPFILLTAKATKDDLHLGMELGADDYLTKPFTRDELLGAINAQLEKHAAEEQPLQPQWDDTCCELIRSLPDPIHNPLQHILGLAQTLKEENPLNSSADSIERLDEICSAGESLYQLFQNALIYQELVDIIKDPQRLRIVRKHSGESSTQALITEIALAQARRTQRVSDLTLQLEEATIQLAPPKLSKLATEIVRNAFDYSQWGTPISISSYCRGKTFYLTITNQGQGLSVDQIRRLGKHMQVDAAGYRHHYVGLGLRIAKLLAELHSGEFQVESNPQGLTAIAILLPLA
jgi:two-component system, sensor histidine kinase and response regulator